MSGLGKLFDSDDEEENYDDFKIRPQYQGPHGQQILELNSQLSKRFKLDERFVEDFEPETVEDDEHRSEESEERKKNIRILEAVLGHEVGTKPSDKIFKKKKQIRFDPDDENASKLIKVPDTVCEKQKKSKRKKEERVTEKLEQKVPVSIERYVEVCPDLKEILNTATPFSFTQKFSYDTESAENASQNALPSNIEEKKEDQEFGNRRKIGAKGENKSTVNFTPKSKCEIFFTEGDPRFKEGIEFFKRPKDLEEIRIIWQKRREHVLELFKRKRRSSHHSHSNRVQSMQIKNTIRKNNFKK